MVEGLMEVAIAVKDLEAAVASYERMLGYQFELEWELPHEKIRVKAARLGQTQLQLITCTAPEGVLAKFLAQRGEGLHHIAFRVRQLDRMVAELKAKGVQFIPEEPVRLPSLAPVKEGPLAYIFVHPRSARGVLIELIEY